MRALGGRVEKVVFPVITPSRRLTPSGFYLAFVSVDHGSLPSSTRAPAIDAIERRQ